MDGWMNGKKQRATHLAYILPHLGHVREELQAEYRAYDAKAAQCDAAGISWSVMFVTISFFLPSFLFLSFAVSN